MRISYAVVGHTSRQSQAEALAQTLNATLSLDDGTLGEGINHDRAWVAATTQDSDWSVVLEDDAVPIHDFQVQLAEALANAPAPIVSAYLGTSRPPQYQRRIQQALARDTHWILSNELLHHVAVAIRTNLVGQMLTAVECSTLPADYRIGSWARQCDYPIAYTNPSLVDHADGPTVIIHQDGQPRHAPRKAWQVGTRTRWCTTTTHL
jgi:GR25 family glycosyltransferase involved in LPS biosynthesis